MREKIERNNPRRHGENIPTLAPGTLINDKYQILSVLGRGGVGTVYRVKQLFLGKEFALKLLDLHNLSDVTVRRFHQEARTAAQLRHPNLVEVHDFGMLDNIQPYLVMDLIDGPSLAQLLKKRTTLPVDYAVKLCIQVAFGLLYAHEQGVVHRDIKPGNIIILNQAGAATEGSIKIVDFGIAKLMQSEEGEIQELTKTGEVFGSPIYMSPEQCKGTAIDRRSDIYSLGCVMFECLTGSPPFVAENAMSTMMMRLSQDVQTLKQGSLGKEFPPLLESIVQKMLAVDPNDRYQELGALINDLVRLEKNDQDTVVNPTVAKKQTTKSGFLSGKEKWLVSITALVSLAGMFAVDRLWLLRPAEPPPMVSPVSSVSTEEKTSVLQDLDPDKPFQVDLDANAGPTVTTRPDGSQVLHFPVNAGELKIGTEKSQPAQGDVVVPPGALVSLKLSRIMGRHPGIFSHLTNVNFDVIDYGANPLVTDDAINALKEVRHIEEINLNSTGVKSLKPLYDANFLTCLQVGGTVLSEDELLKVKCVPNLTRICFGGQFRDATKMLDELVKKNKIQFFEYDGSALGQIHPPSGLSEKSLESLSKLTSIKHLTIKNCTEFNNDSLKRLQTLKNLEELHIRFCRLTGSALPTILSFKKLRFVKVTGSGWSPEQRAALRVRHPNCEFEKGSLEQKLEEQTQMRALDGLKSP